MHKWLGIILTDGRKVWFLHPTMAIICIWGVSRKLATFEKMTVTGMYLRVLNVFLLHYPFMYNPRYCLGCATQKN